MNFPKQVRNGGSHAIKTSRSATLKLNASVAANTLQKTCTLTQFWSLAELLDHVDYLSCVSGGSAAALSLFSHAFIHNKNKTNNNKDERKHGGRHTVPNLLVIQYLTPFHHSAANSRIDESEKTALDAETGHASLSLELTGYEATSCRCCMCIYSGTRKTKAKM